MLTTMFEGSGNKERGFLNVGSQPCLAEYGAGYIGNSGESQIICNKDYTMPNVFHTPQKGNIRAFIVPHYGMYVFNVWRDQGEFQLSIHRVESITGRGLFRLVFYGNSLPEKIKEGIPSFLPIEMAKIMCVAVRKTFFYNHRTIDYAVKEVYQVDIPSNKPGGYLLDELTGKDLAKMKSSVLNAPYELLFKYIETSRSSYLKEIGQ